MRRSLSRARLLAIALAAASVAAVLVVSASSAASKPVVKEVKSAKLHATILVTRKGFTLVLGHRQQASSTAPAETH